ncbi:sterol desaturase family protein [Microscilla marina]|uniref:Sterol desaturase n=1 Tax=Microscilla marina ATCC 23134 TaxID=313606 RepID=A1ZSG4_MICM2|nr:sterol desaturase family protein [Microscilla marina]EAY26712.1 sterol desaturase [Microscilla marina ATCC 23134]
MKQIITQLEQNTNTLIAAFLLFSVGLALIEFVWELYTRKIDRQRLKEMGASVWVFLFSFLTEKIGNVLFFASFFWLANLITWQLPVNSFTVIATLLFVDLLYYWEHRLEHEVRLLWGYHSIHHSSPIYNYTTALRVSFFDNFVTWVFYLPAVLLGFHPVVILLAIGVMLMYQFWLHTELIGKMGWFGKVFNTPSHHRVHHGSDEMYLDKNYGGILIIWDKLFGTFQPEIKKPTYGLTEQINTTHPVKVHLYEFNQILKDVRKASNVKEAKAYLWNKPGWAPSKEAGQVDDTLEKAKSTRQH